MNGIQIRDFILVACKVDIVDAMVRPGHCPCFMALLVKVNAQPFVYFTTNTEVQKTSEEVMTFIFAHCMCQLAKNLSPYLRFL